MVFISNYAHKHFNMDYEYVKRNSVLITIYCIELWQVETNDKVCTSNNVRHIEPDQYECQRHCENNADCVGISYSNAENYRHLCFVCFDDILIANDHGLNFYRHPGK